MAMSMSWVVVLALLAAVGRMAQALVLSTTPNLTRMVPLALGPPTPILCPRFSNVSLRPPLMAMYTSWAAATIPAAVLLPALSLRLSTTPNLIPMAALVLGLPIATLCRLGVLAHLRLLLMAMYT